MNSLWETGLLSTINLVRHQSGRIKDLKGFRKGHQVPSDVSDHTQAFIGRIAEQDLLEDLDERFDEFRRQLKFRRVDIAVTDPVSGVAQISTPWFDYQISILHDPNDASAVLWRKQLSEFRRIDKLNSAEVKAVFATTFDTVELAPPAAIDVAAMIDQIEDEADERISLDYDRQTTWCAVTIQGIAGKMQFTSDRISLFIHQAQPPAKLLDSFFQVKLRISEIQHR